jgi:DNA polymerase III delta prime subunit
MLDRSRQELLDLGLRNPLINHSKHRGLKILEEDSSFIFNALVNDGKNFSFQPIEEEKSGAIADEKSNENYLIEQNSNPRNVGYKLKTSFDADKLATKLLRLFSESRTIIEEQGVNALYLALGMFHWFESSNSQVDRSAPLVLIPVELQRSTAQERFKIKYSDAEIDCNLSLYAKMKEDFGITLPDFPDQDDFIFSKYVDQIKSAIHGMTQWYIDENEIYLGFFSFNKFLMYKDLDGSNWPDNNKPHLAKIFDFLFGEGFLESSNQISDEIFLDELPEVEDVSFVLDADSSQTSAILDIRHGMHLVIQGPPGTGKSQTITNIISDSLAQGKRILFVSEKIAALEVVKRRLDLVGLGEACLELHSHKTNKKEVLAELKRTIELGKPKIADDEIIESRLKEIKAKLNEYCSAINTPILNSKISPNQAIGAISKLKEKFRGIDKPSICGNPIVPDSSRLAMQQNYELLQQVQRALESIRSNSENPFQGVQKKDLLPFERMKIETLLSSLHVSINEIISYSARVSKLLLGHHLVNFSNLSEANAVWKIIFDSAVVSSAPINIELLLQNESEIWTAYAWNQQIKKIHERFECIVCEEAWDFDFSSIKSIFEQYRKSIFRFIVPQYRSAKKASAVLYKRIVHLLLKKHYRLWLILKLRDLVEPHYRMLRWYYLIR